MRDDLRQGLLSRLRQDYAFVVQGDYLRRGRCPNCGKLELFVSAKEPWVIKCGRENRCGWTGAIRDLYPDAFGQMNERFPPTTESPNATADAYMSFVRHLDITGIRGWWRQGNFRHPAGDRGTATVVFDVIAPDVPARSVFMERLIETVNVREDDGEVKARKANFVGSHKGLWWQPPDFEIGDGEELWLVEGCIDAIALHPHGIKAVATLSCVNYPDRMLAALAERGIRPVLVWALDGDAAGRKWTKKHAETARQAGYACKAALIPQSGSKKLDWADAHAAKLLDEASLARYRYHGDLELAPTALDKGLLIWRRHRSTSFSLEFGSRIWWFDIPAPVFAANLELVGTEGKWTSEEDRQREAAKRSANLSEIANVAFQFLYFQASHLTDESWYYARVRFPHSRFEIKNTFTGAQVASATEFKKRLLSIAPGALFTGGTWQLNWLVKHHLDTIKIVDTVDFLGYSKEHKAYIFNDTAVATGKVYPINDEDFFEIGSTSVKSLNGSLHLQIGKRSEYRPDWPELVFRSFGPKGLIAAAFFLGSLVAEQVRDLHKSFPFLEVVGEAGAGKSTLIEFLWKLVGRNDYEGFDPNKSTLAARARIMTQVANLPISMIESDREDTAKARQFDWDELKTAYNGRASRARGVNNGGNETKEPPFRGTILISQNEAVNASEAIMQRIIHLHFDTRGHNASSKIAADTLASLPVESVSHFLVMATTRESAIVKTVAERAPIHEAELIKRPRIRSHRIAKNHAQLMALVEALGELTEMPEAWIGETLAVLGNAAEQRQTAIASEHSIVEEFWEVVEFLGLSNVNHSKQPDDTIAINLNQIISMAGMASHPMPAIAELKKHLRTSRTRPFLDVKPVRSGIPSFDDRLVRCWVFKAPAKGNF